MKLISLKALLTPILDPYTHQPFRGCHLDFLLTFKRKGNSLSIIESSGRDSNDGFIRSRARVIQVSEFIEDALASALAVGYQARIVDDIPEGVSILD